MNRHQRRSAARAARNRRKHDQLYHAHIRHLPTLPLDAPFGPGVHHVCIHHDPHCRFYETERLDDCNCRPVITRHVEPRRS